ncbi:hypothetical protein D9613_009589 [Agrocybe pediades]|uniref:Uncharacterized protein n=1 Tax=Agrocybe pediades TaxID=84607 RepID=A0A8H4R395_9AGAR|nr:hypothetical protein D9613_009589 [Agrocybe pediades]
MPLPARHYSTLNYDVWLYIASFLTLQELWNARFLNEVVFGVAMDAGYQVVHVPTDYRHFEGFTQWFPRFYGADVGHRVRTIHFSPLAALRKSSWDQGRRTRASINDDLVPQERVLSFYQKLLQQSATTKPTMPTNPKLPTKPTQPTMSNRRLSMLARIKHRLQGIFPVKPQLSPEQTFQMSVAQFSAVSNIIVDLHYWERAGEIFPPVEFGMPSFMIKASSSNLKSLSLNVPISMALCFLSEAPHYPNLEKLSIEKQIWEWYDESQTETPSETWIQPLATFINRHADTLLSLALRLPIQGSNFAPGPYPAPSSPSGPHISSIFKNFDKIPNLVHLSLHLFRDTDPQGLRQFLRRQTRTLRKLELILEKNLSYIGADQVLAIVRDSLVHCRLSSLSIQYRIDNDEWQRSKDEPNTRMASALGLIRNSITQSNLTSLEISGYYTTLLPAELREILEMRGGIRRLRHLALRVQVMTADMFDLIVSELPALQSLDLTACAFKGRSSYYRDWEQDFALEMKTRTYADWGLQSLKLAVASEQPSLSGGIAVRGLVHALPNVHTFNGLSRSEYLSQLID